VGLTRIRRMFVFKGEEFYAYFGGHGRKCTILDHAERAEWGGVS